jgi:hypothetical protein
MQEQFVSVEDLQAHYKAVKNRLAGPPKIKNVPKKTPVPPSPSLEEKFSLEPEHAKIIREVAKEYDIAPAAMFSRFRITKLTDARDVACWRMKHDLNMSFPEIGRVFSRHHSAVLRGCLRAKKIIGE